MLGQSRAHKDKTAPEASHMGKALFDEEDNVVLAAAKITRIDVLGCQLQWSPGSMKSHTGFEL